MGFIEFTASDGDSEVMFDVDDETGKVIDLYTYSDHNLEYYSESRDDWFLLASGWKTKGNPLFVHCPSVRVPFCIKKLLIDNEFMFSGDEIADELFKMVKYYKFPADFQLL